MYLGTFEQLNFLYVCNFCTIKLNILWKMRFYYVFFKIKKTILGC